MSRLEMYFIELLLRACDMLRVVRSSCPEGLSPPRVARHGDDQGVPETTH